jgi:hypothetical protein
MSTRPVITPTLPGPGGFLPRKFRVYGERREEQIEALSTLDAEQRFAMQVVVGVLPSRVNEDAGEERIDRDTILEDAISRRTCPHRGMLARASHAPC